jgi:hypothetical protein
MKPDVLPEQQNEARDPRVGNDLFLHNMRALWRQDPQLAMHVDAVDDDERLELERTLSGHWTVRVPTPAGKRTYLHSRYRPIEEAEKLAKSVILEDKHCFVVLGFGLGYHVRALYERLRGDALIICTEPSIRLLSTALSCVDLADVIGSGRLVVLTDENKVRLHERLRPHSALIMLGAQFVRHAPSLQVAGDVHNGICSMITEFVTYSRMSLMTLVTNSKITCQNIAMNLVHYVTTPSIDVLHERFARCPAVIISAGPSLRKNIDRLAGLKGRAVLCAVQTTLKLLMERGIVPDFVTSLDFHEMSRKFYEGVDGLEQVHLVAEPKATWHVLDRYAGPISLLGSDWAALLLGERLGRRSGLKAGATVAHLAFYLAVFMGCDPIIFVGQDLAFTGHVFYVPGVEIHGAWRSEINRFNTMEMKEWERVVRNRPILRKVQGQDGRELYSDELLFTYLEQFEKDIAAVPVKVINATEGGARIRGTEPMTLEDAIARYCQKPIEPERFDYLTTSRWRDHALLGPAGAELSRRLEEIEDIKDLCEELLTLLNELKGLTDDPARFNQRLVRVDELRTKVQYNTRGYRIINAACQLIEFRRFSADRRISTFDGSDVERAKRQLDRDIEFITGVRDGADEVAPFLRDSLRRIARAEEGS